MMFSPSGITPQAGGLLSQMSTVLNSFKMSSIGRCMSFVQTKTQHDNNTKLKMEPSVATASDTVISDSDPYATFLEEFGLSSVPAELLSQLTMPSSFCQCNTNSTDNFWRVSHVSSDSFFKNKHGFSSRPGNLRHKSSIFMTCFSKIPWLHTTFHTQNRGMHSHSLRRIQQLEERANAEEHNPRAQSEYLRALVQEDPNYVVRRYESGKYAIDQSVTNEYLKALVMTDRVNQVDMKKILSSGNDYGSTSSHGAPTSPLVQTGTEDSPIHVITQNQKGSFFREQFWNTVRFLIALFLITSLIEGQLQMKLTSGHKDIQPNTTDRKCRFSDVQGVDEAKQELKDVVEFLRNPERFKRLGGKMPTGVLLIGSPGTGKTLLAKAVAGEAGVPFFFCSGSEFDEMFVGVGAARVRNLFAAAKEHAPCIVFIDELDAIGGTRIVHDHQPYSRMTLNQLLVELDGFDTGEGIVVIGATNFPEVLDKALIRPGRFDTKITVPMPDVKGRHDILKVHLKKVQVAEEINVEVLARGTVGFSGKIFFGNVCRI